jgi:hypothetical protein
MQDILSAPAEPSVADETSDDYEEEEQEEVGKDWGTAREPDDEDNEN